MRNSVQLIGNLGRDPEMVELDGGKKLVKFSIATNEFFRVDGEKRTQTQWHNIIAWGRTAELMRDLLKKGSQVAIHGKLQHRSYEDKGGQVKYISEVVANEFVTFSQTPLPV